MNQNYRHSIYLRTKNTRSSTGLHDYLQCVCTSPGSLKRMLHYLRIKNPKRDYWSDDPENP